MAYDAYVLVMTQDTSIVNDPLADGWNQQQRYYWNTLGKYWQAMHQNDQLAANALGQLGIPTDANIIVIAHGNSDRIGNKGDTLEIYPPDFARFIKILTPAGPPRRIFIDACQVNHAIFAAKVVTEMKETDSNHWSQTTVYGHEGPVCGQVPNFQGEGNGDWRYLGPNRAS